jgi:hypothetical protein
MLSMHTEVENLFNLLHQRRAQHTQHTRRQQAYRALVAAILDEPVTSVRDVPVYQPAYAGTVTTLAPRRSRAA